MCQGFNETSLPQIDSATREKSKFNKEYPRDTDIYWCVACKEYNNITKITIPYSLKLMIQEFMALGIKMTINTNSDGTVKLLQ